MSSKQNSISATSHSTPHASEYQLIKRDLIKVLLLNSVYLAALLVLYFTNQKSHYLDNWLAAIFKF